MNKLVILTVGMLAISSCSEAQRTATKTEDTQTISKVVSAQEFKSKMEGSDLQLIDVRTPDEYNSGKIGNAKNIDFYAADFKEAISKLDKSKTTLIYCASGGRSGNAAEMMQAIGFQEVYDLKGGYNGWPDK